MVEGQRGHPERPGVGACGGEADRRRFETTGHHGGTEVGAGPLQQALQEPVRPPPADERGLRVEDRADREQEPGEFVGRLGC